MRRAWMSLAILAALVLIIAACEPAEDDPVLEDDPLDAPDDDVEEEEPAEEPEEPEDEPEDVGEVDADVDPAGDLCEGEYADIDAPDGFTVGLVTDIGSVDDGTFNQYAYEGVLEAVECFGIDEDNVSVIETASEADYDRNLDTILTIEPDVVVTVGFLLQDATEEYAVDNADTNFIGVDQFADGEIENFVGLQFREDQGGFLAGSIAAMMTETGTVAAIGGPEEVPAIPRFLNGYRMGAEHVDDGVNVLTINIPSFTDPAGGRSAAEQFLGEGADVVFGAAGPTGSGGIQAAAEGGAWAIGVDQDEWYTTFDEGAAAGAENLLTSAVKRVDVGVFANIANTITGDWEAGNFILDAENEGITYADFHEADVPDDVAEELESIRQGLADGSIETGVDPETGELLE